MNAGLQMTTTAPAPVGGLFKRVKATMAQDDHPSLASRSLGDSQARVRYRPLPMLLQSDGYTLRQIAREGDAAIYEKKPLAERAEESASYEVVIIRRRDGFTVGDRNIEPAEYYPRNEDWGSFGWTVLDRDAAFGKLRHLLRDIRE